MNPLPGKASRNIWEGCALSRPHTFGVAGLIRGGGLPRPQIPAGLRARPIGHWQHWNWQHFHIGNIFTTPQKTFSRAALRRRTRFGTLSADKDSDVGVTGMRRMSFAYGREQSLPLVFEEEC